MVDHDEHIGMMLDKLDELGIADDTIVMYSTDNGPHYNSWPDAGITPFRSEKDTNWEGGWRVPGFVRWPGKFKAGTVLNGIVTHQDCCRRCWRPRASRTIKKLLEGYKVGDKTFKVHLDGYNMFPYLTGEVKESPRPFFFYFSDDGDVIALRLGDWKMKLMEQRAKTMGCGSNRSCKLRVPHIVQPAARPVRARRRELEHLLRLDGRHAFLIYEMQAIVAEQIAGLREVPAAPEAGLVQPGRGDGAVVESRRILSSTGSCRHSRGRPMRPRGNRPMQGTIPCMGSFTAPQVS